MKGIVFEVLDDMATILMNDGGFIAVPARKSWKTGDLVTVQARRITFPAITVIAASIILVLASLFSVLAISNNQAALISIDINPSIEISVNRFGKVISADARNDEGSALLDAVDVSGMPYVEAVLRLMDNEIMSQYFTENGLLVFSVHANNTAWQEKVMSTLRNSTDSYLYAHHSGYTTEYFIADGQIVTEAHQHGTTPGKYMLLLELESVAPNVNIDEYTHHSVNDIQAEINAHHGQENSGSGEGREHGTTSQATSSSGYSTPSPSSQNEPELASSQEPAQPPASQSSGRHEDEGHNNGGHDKEGHD